VPSKFVDLVPQVVRNHDGRDVWVLNGKQIAVVGSTAPAGFPEFPASRPRVYADLQPGSFDAVERLRYMDQAGSWAQVLYPNVGGFGSQHFLGVNDPNLQLMCVRAYNDFVHEWAAADPRRLIGIISLPFWDVDAAVTEVERCAELNFRGVLFTGEPQRFGLPTIGHPHWDRLWSVARAAALPVHFHIGGGEDDMRSSITARVEAHGAAEAETYCAVDLFMKNGIQCADLITSGVLQRLPDLQFVSVESGIGWIPFVLEAADYTYLGATRSGRRRGDELLPSDLFRRQVYTTYWFESVAPQLLLETIPVDNILFETDFPHVACLFGNIRETIDTGLAAAPPGVREKILWGNSARLYRIDDPDPADLDRIARLAA
jgi:predicted TIM-barrel fold metal-dependent hydrolase